jgi:hypothetical protein
LTLTEKQPLRFAGFAASAIARVVFSSMMRRGMSGLEFARGESSRDGKVDVAAPTARVRRRVRDGVAQLRSMPKSIHWTAPGESPEPNNEMLAACRSKDGAAGVSIPRFPVSGAN